MDIVSYEKKRIQRELEDTKKELIDTTEIIAEINIKYELSSKSLPWKKNLKRKFTSYSNEWKGD